MHNREIFSIFFKDIYIYMQVEWAHFQESNFAVFSFDPLPNRR